MYHKRYVLVGVFKLMYGRLVGFRAFDPLTSFWKRIRSYHFWYNFIGFLHAPAEHRDILLHQIASILFRAGGSTNREASIDVLRKSLKINDKEPLSYYTMGHNLVARGNLTGAVEFYRWMTSPYLHKLASSSWSNLFSYAYSLNPVIQESYQCLFVTKCGFKRQANGLPISDPTVPEGDDAAFWEKSWRVSLDRVSLILVDLFLLDPTRLVGEKSYAAICE